jgi:nitroimidazol reductase NimA-like FMN-containing flavoprotein (pyridoxamine 5'-phosphate oxidase superfamily)
MQKQEREITDENEITQILLRGKYATIAMCRSNEPYIVTLSYGYDKDANCLYFHTALQGLKLYFLSQNPFVCATVIDDRNYAPNLYKYAYASVVLFGKMSVVADPEEKKHGMTVLLNQLENDPQPGHERNLNDDSAYEKLVVLKLKIEEITGKKGP